MNLNRVIQTTADASHTIAIPKLNVTYHSKYGAIQESMHVFIQNGLEHFLSLNNVETIPILEVGFETGLNALLTLNEAIRLNQKIVYRAIEPFPISIEEANVLNYVSLVNQQFNQEFLQMHSCAFNEEITLNQFFTFI